MWVAVHVTCRRPSEARWLPPPDLSQLLFMEEVSSRLLLFQLGMSYLRHAAWTVAFGPDNSRKDFQSSAHIHITACARFLFHPFLSELKHNKQGEVISLQLPIRGSALKRLDDPCEGVIRYASALLYVWRRADPTRCQEWGKKLYPWELEGQTGLGLFFKQTLPAPSLPKSLRILTRSHFLLWALCAWSSSKVWLVSSDSGDACEERIWQLSYAPETLFHVLDGTSTWKDLEKKIIHAKNVPTSSKSHWQLR